MLRNVLQPFIPTNDQHESVLQKLIWVQTSLSHPSQLSKSSFHRKNTGNKRTAVKNSVKCQNSRESECDEGVGVEGKSESKKAVSLVTEFMNGPKGSQKYTRGVVELKNIHTQKYSLEIPGPTDNLNASSKNA